MLDAVIDISHWNSITNINAVKKQGTLGIIHKATEGLHTIDDTYASHKILIQNNDFLWGTYHFGILGNGEAQAEHYLEVVNPEKDELIVLDFESYILRDGTDHTMALGEAEKFVQKIYDEIARWPGLYSTSIFLDSLPIAPASVLKNCWLWLARYNDHQPVTPNGFGQWKLWQYTDGKAGRQPYVANGIGPCDRNLFNGGIDELNTFWQNS